MKSIKEKALDVYPKMSRISEPHGIIPADNESHYIGDANEDNRNAFKADAKWQKEQFEKYRLAHCDALTEEQAQIESDFVIQHLKKNSRTPTFVDAIEYGMRLQKEKDESIIEDLGNYINELSKQFPEVSFAKLSRIAVRVAKWQKQQDQSTIELAEDHAYFAGSESQRVKLEKIRDNFIEKACRWIRENITNNPHANSVLVRNGCVTLGMLVDDFKKYMTKE